MKEMEEFRKAMRELREVESGCKEAMGNASMRHVERRRALVASLFLELGEVAFWSLKAEMASFTHEAYRDRIDAMKAERAERARERQAIHDAEMERKIQDHNENIAAIVQEAKDRDARQFSILTADKANDLGDGAVVLNFKVQPVLAERIDGMWHCTNMICGIEWTMDNLEAEMWLLLRSVDHG